MPALPFSQTTASLYRVKLKSRRGLDALTPCDQGWWNSQPNSVILVRPATDQDVADVYLKDGASRDPQDYWKEAHGSWLVLRRAVASVALDDQETLTV